MTTIPLEGGSRGATSTAVWWRRRWRARLTQWGGLPWRFVAAACDDGDGGLGRIFPRRVRGGEGGGMVAGVSRGCTRGGLILQCRREGEGRRVWAGSGVPALCRLTGQVRAGGRKKKSGEVGWGQGG